jgi:hypothetical protein
MREEVRCLYTLERAKVYLRNPASVRNCTDIRFENIYAGSLCLWNAAVMSLAE